MFCLVVPHKRIQRHSLNSCMNKILGMFNVGDLMYLFRIMLVHWNVMYIKWEKLLWYIPSYNCAENYLAKILRNYIDIIVTDMEMLNFNFIIKTFNCIMSLWCSKPGKKCNICQNIRCNYILLNITNMLQRLKFYRWYNIMLYLLNSSLMIKYFKYKTIYKDIRLFVC